MTKPTAENIPVRTGDRLELTVERLNSSGDGIAKKEGYILFLPEALPGDQVLAEVVKTTPRFGVASVVERRRASPDRIEAPCPVFPRCGGCRFQDLNYQAQLDFKTQVVRDSLEHLAGLDPCPPLQTVAAEATYHYRNKAGFVLQGRGRSLAAGFFSKGTHEVVDSPFCDTLAGPINEVKEWIRGLLVKHHVSIYDETRHLGFLRGLVVRHAEQTGQTLVGLVTMRGVFKKRFLPDLTQARELKRFGIVGILQNFNSQKTNVLLGPKSRPLWGRDYLVEELDGLKFRVSLGSFFQVNAAQAKNLYAIIEDWTKGDGGLVVDAYCGSGGISLWLARAGRRVLGIDECAPAVADARSSAEWNGLAGCRFLAGTLETRLKDLEAEPAIDTLIVDPPRKGLSAEVIAAIPRLRPGKLVYVSCNPATLARDLAQLPGYAIRDLRVVDMFPQTQHVETAALLERC